MSQWACRQPKKYTGKLPFQLHLERLRVFEPVSWLFMMPEDLPGAFAILSDTSGMLILLFGLGEDLVPRSGSQVDKTVPSL